MHEGSTARVEEYLAECTAALRLIPTPILNDLPQLVDAHGLEAAANFLGVDQQLVRTALGVLEIS